MKTKYLTMLLLSTTLILLTACGGGGDTTPSAIPTELNSVPDTDDSDGDGVLDSEDAFPLDATETIDTDNDGIGNNTDTDDDDDGVLDSEDAFPLDATETIDTDNDGIGNNTDTDDDGDGVLDTNDDYPLDSDTTVDFTLNDIVGSWATELNSDTSLTFNADSSGLYTFGDDNEPITYTINDNILEVIAPAWSTTLLKQKISSIENDVINFDLDYYADNPAETVGFPEPLLKIDDVVPKITGEFGSWRAPTGSECLSSGGTIYYDFYGEEDGCYATTLSTANKICTDIETRLPTASEINSELIQKCGTRSAIPDSSFDICLRQYNFSVNYFYWTSTENSDGYPVAVNPYNADLDQSATGIVHVQCVVPLVATETTDKGE